jgi:hypothetical protein
MTMGTMGRVGRLRRVKPEQCPVAASPVRRVEITPEVEAEALAKLATCGSAGSTERPELATGRALAERAAVSLQAPLAGGRRAAAAAVEPGSVTDLRSPPTA